MRNNYYNDPSLQELSSCQRNFDQTKSIEPEKIAILDEWASKPPQQTSDRYVAVIKISNLECMLELSKLCYPDFGLEPDNPDKIYQPQINGSICYVYTLERGKDIYPSQFFSGFESGLLVAKATQLGLKTGFTKCIPHNFLEWDSWKTKWNIPQIHHKFSFAVSVGYPIEGKPYYWSNDENTVQGEGIEHYHNVPDWANLTIVE
jgi:hypothetical protein